MVQCTQKGSLLTNPLDLLGCWGAPAYVMDFADDMLPSLDLCRQKDHGMAAVANGPVSDGIAVLE
jgi:hypothetical protein